MVEPQAQPVRLGKYRVEKKIGVGGMAEIYLASLVSDPTAQFAIKKILSPYANNEHLVSMLVNEAQVTASLRHPNIVPIYDFGRVEDSYYLAMEFVAGKDLKSIIYACRRSGQSFPINIALFVIMEALEGLSYAHKKKDNFNRPLEIVHRDVSPQNIMISNEGEVKVLDFGIAKVRGKAAETQAGILKGKFSYMSPEQARGEKIDRRTDIFSCGITLYELLTLENPFFYDSELETLNHVKRARYQSPRLLNRRIPKSLERVVRKAMQRRRLFRYSWAEEMQKGIARIQRDEVGEATSADLKRFLKRVLQGGEETGEHEITERSKNDGKKYSFESSNSSSDIYYVSILQQRRRRRILAVAVFLLLVLPATYFMFKDDSTFARFAQQTSAWFEQLTGAKEQDGISNDEKDRLEQERISSLPIGRNIEVRFVGKATVFLDRLSFERYEIVRNQITDAIIERVSDKEVGFFGKGRIFKVTTNGYQVSYRLLMPQKKLEVILISQ
jgi:serine/threonine protein kinase